MSIKKYISEKDTTIADAYKADLKTRSTDANLGASDSLEVFSIYGQASQNSLEKSRILVQFPIDQLVADRSDSKIPQSGSVNFFFRLFNVEHPFSLPKNYTLDIYPLAQQWDEGYGLDMEGYQDRGWNDLLSGYGATWKYATSGTLWSSDGGYFLTSSQYHKTAYFKTGVEDIEVDITNIVEDWASNTLPNCGLVVKLTNDEEDGTNFTSYYTKKFSSNTSQFFYKRPSIEARWAAVVQDDRNNFYASSSALEASDNTMNLYYFNKPRGVLKNIVGNVLPDVSFYADESLTNEITPDYKSISNPIAGVYKVQVAIDTTASVLYDKWYNTSSLSTYFTDSFDVNPVNGYNNDSESEYVINITNLKNIYTDKEAARFKIFSRKKDWNPTIYTIANSSVENSVINNLYYKIFRFSDNYVIIDYSTGSLPYSKTSYDSQGNYFDLDMSLLEKNYGYGIKLAVYDGLQLKEFSKIFKFRVE